MLRILIGLLVVLSLRPSTASAQLVETEIPNVSAEVVELRQQGGVMRLAIRLVNASDTVATGHTMYWSQFTLIDAKSKAKHFVLKGADGNYLAGPASDSNNGGRWHVYIPARSQAILWALFEPLGSGTVVSVQAPAMFPFDRVRVGEGAGVLFSDRTTSTAVPAVTATLISAQRADQRLTLRLRLVAGPANLSFAPTILYQNVFFFDPNGKRKYSIIRDTSGNFEATPVTDNGNGGRLFLSYLQPKSVALVSLTLQAPPDAVTSGDLLIPGFLPIEGLVIAGLGGADAGGTAAAGRSLGFEGALKELGGTVTPAGIAINVSSDVLFDVDKADLKPAAEQSLQQLLIVVTEKPGTIVSVVGHTDTRGDEPYNQTLSERRANAVKTWLAAHAVPAGRISASGAGESRPLKPGETEEAHRANRRVEVAITPFVAAVWIGTWKLNVAASTSIPGPPMRGQTTSIQAIDGGVTITADGIDAQGRPTRTEYAARAGDSDLPYKGGINADTVAFTRVDAQTFDMVYKLKGKVVLTSRSVFSPDGKLRVVTQTGTDTQGRTINNRLVYDRQ